jgi:hypothetical protein
MDELPGRRNLNCGAQTSVYRTLAGEETVNPLDRFPCRVRSLKLHCDMNAADDQDAVFVFDLAADLCR